MKEREKRFAERKVLVGTLRDENASLKYDKKKLQTEIDELKNCLETFNIQLGDTGGKLHMPWLLSQLRDNVSLKERVTELEEIIRSGGYTIKAAEAERDYRKKEFELAAEIENVTSVMEMLKDQVQGVDKTNAAVLLGKLEEALSMFGYDAYEKEHIDDMVTAASSDITSMISNDTFKAPVIVSIPSTESWNKPGCSVMPGFTEGCSPSRGIFQNDSIGDQVDVVVENEKEHNDEKVKSKKDEEGDGGSSHVDADDVHLMSISRESSYVSSEAPIEDIKPVVYKRRIIRVIVNGVDDHGHR